MKPSDRETDITESDRFQFFYLQSFIIEVQRLRAQAEHKLKQNEALEAARKKAISLG